MKTWNAISLLGMAGTFLVLVGAPATSVGKEIKKDYHETFSVGAGDRLHLVHGDGDVSIIPWEQDELEVTVAYHVDISRVGVGSDPDFEVEFRQEGGTVHVIGKEKSMTTVGYVSKKQHRYLYTIKAPRTLHLDLEGDDGDVEIERWSGEIECLLEDGDLTLTDIAAPRTMLKLEDGDLRIDGLTGELELTAEDGDVYMAGLEEVRCHLELEDGDLFVQDLEGSLRARSEDGDVDVVRARAEDLEIRTDDGNVVVDVLPGHELDLHVETGDGDITVELATGLSARFSVDVDDGGIRLDLPGARIDRDEDDSAAGSIGDGTGRIRLRSGDGRVTLRQRD